MLYQQFYSELAKRVYAIAYIDDSISKKGKREIINIVRNELVPAEKHIDKFGTEAAFSSFLNFIEKHYTALDERMKEVSLHMAKKLTTATNKTSKKEGSLLLSEEQCFVNFGNNPVLILN